MKKDRCKIWLVLLLCFTMIGTMMLAACSQADEEEEEEPEIPHNALTGETAEDGFDESALDRRIVAFVVENAPDARPQWGMDDENYSPDIVLQGEVEGGITRMLWFYADYNKLPEIIGPTRSARPPFIRFSSMFDSIFVHWGMSHSSGDYIGANTIFNKFHTDHINQMTLDDKEGLYGRDTTRAVNTEHRGIIYTSKLAATIANEGFRTEPEEYTKLYFSDAGEPVSDTAATQIGVKYSSRSYEDTYWTYNEEDGLYHCSDFENDFTRENLLVLYDDTEYITKSNYQGPGSAGSVTYCDYLFSGGKALLFSKGTAKEINWKRDKDNNELILIDPSVSITSMEDIEAIQETNKALRAQEKKLEAGEEIAEEDLVEGEKVVLVLPELEEGLDEEAAEEATVNGAYAAQPLNKGKTWIGWISNNNGGSVSYH